MGTNVKQKMITADERGERHLQILLVKASISIAFLKINLALQNREH